MYGQTPSHCWRWPTNLSSGLASGWGPNISWSFCHYNCYLIMLCLVLQPEPVCHQRRYERQISFDVPGSTCSLSHHNNVAIHRYIWTILWINWMLFLIIHDLIQNRKSYLLWTNKCRVLVWHCIPFESKVSSVYSPLSFLFRWLILVEPLLWVKRDLFPMPLVTIFLFFHSNSVILFFCKLNLGIFVLLSTSWRTTASPKAP